MWVMKVVSRPIFKATKRPLKQLYSYYSCRAKSGHAIAIALDPQPAKCITTQNSYTFYINQSVRTLAATKWLITGRIG